MVATRDTAKKSSTAVIALAWLVVSLPLAWGIYNTGLNAAKLFAPLKQPPAAAASAH
jgi:hypothetical protein